MASEAPDLHEGHIEAARCWYAKPSGTLLSTIVDYVWTGPVERNDAPPDEKPNPNSSGWRGPASTGERPPEDRYGFYALTVEDARRRLRNELRIMGDWSDRAGRHLLAPVLGRVRLFGTVHVHEHGYRAQGVRIERLAVLQVERARYHPDGWEELVEKLEERFRCPVQLWRWSS